MRGVEADSKLYSTAAVAVAAAAGGGGGDVGAAAKDGAHSVEL